MQGREAANPANRIIIGKGEEARKGDYDRGGPRMNEMDGAGVLLP